MKQPEQSTLDKETLTHSCNTDSPDTHLLPHKPVSACDGDELCSTVDVASEYSQETKNTSWTGFQVASMWFVIAPLSRKTAWVGMSSMDCMV